MKVWGNKKGFTLIEIGFSVGITILIMFGALTAYLVSDEAGSRVFTTLSGQQEARSTLNSMVTEIRRAQISSLGGYPIEFADENTLIFFANIDEDARMERVRYFLDGTTLRKGIIKPDGIPLTYNEDDEVVITQAEGVRNSVDGTPIFQYYNDEFFGTEDSLSYPLDIPEISLVHIELVMDQDLQEPPGPKRFSSAVQIRSLKRNL